ncbi:uncharacterized protein N0V89_003354 [Didymosphaeria variabile]|uniref:GPI anchored protein n=1 Tax=Didymosphaeria variabile TaxID=1932322 RepID=A0A9W8XVY6_9PLEO|nr:uncharacterized protein N0V89_003354 [Didymosphaeria variabile]KAJ4358770.1 hypothetical protein N0V89_003354 [Didymosphaeria variabile]
MRAATLFFPLAFAFAANAINLSIGPDTVCGDNSVDCSNGFCCSSGNKCDTSGTVTKCGNDGTLALPYGINNLASAVESQAKSAINDFPLSSLVGDLGSLGTAVPTSFAAALSSILSDKSFPTDAAGVSSLINLAPSAARPAVSSALADVNSILGVETSGSGSGQAQNTGAEGAASMVGASTFGNTAALVGMIWGAAAIGGAMLVL